MEKRIIDVVIPAFNEEISAADGASAAEVSSAIVSNPLIIASTFCSSFARPSLDDAKLTRCCAEIECERGRFCPPFMLLCCNNCLRLSLRLLSPKSDDKFVTSSRSRLLLSTASSNSGWILRSMDSREKSSLLRDVPPVDGK